MKHAALAALAILYWVVVGHGHSWVFVTLMLAAIWFDFSRGRRRRHYCSSRAGRE